MATLCESGKPALTTIPHPIHKWSTSLESIFEADVASCQYSRQKLRHSISLPPSALAYAFLAYVFWWVHEGRTMSAQERGLARLMLKIPAFRNRFARMQDLRFRSVCEEYDLVWEVITQWSQDGRCAMFNFDDYRRLAASIESDAIAMAEAVPDPGPTAKAASPQPTPSASSESDKPPR
ncbi:hypothetical protein AB4118_19680 [Bosea sp. 2RAB26]